MLGFICMKSVASQALGPSSPPHHKLSHLLGPLPLERDVLYGRLPRLMFDLQRILCKVCSNLSLG